MQIQEKNIRKKIIGKKRQPNEGSIIWEKYSALNREQRFYFWKDLKGIINRNRFMLISRKEFDTSNLYLKEAHLLCKHLGLKVRQDSKHKKTYLEEKD